ncbi:hypothetical protein GGP41_008208 [Bipolaris sorokiniana]|uniref:Uncharacterized protein n=1 Tax=Cochliobolus sativus TaxID=45130 RepID=A0A8H5ZLF3_COCSA|nr:hypothetical protein GGP41_008208 [Bipolaris sorokiniana]
MHLSAQVTTKQLRSKPYTQDLEDHPSITKLHFIATIFFAPSLDFASVLTTRTRHMMVAAMQCRDNRGVVGLPLAEAPAAKGHLHLHTFRHVLNNLR